MPHKTGSFRAILEASENGQKYLKKNHHGVIPVAEPEPADVWLGFPVRKSTYVNKEELENKEV